MRDCLTDPPSVPGSYNVAVRGVMTFMPIFWDFDGTKWDIRHYGGYLNSGELTQGDAHWFEGTRCESQ